MLPQFPNRPIVGSKPLSFFGDFLPKKKMQLITPPLKGLNVSVFFSIPNGQDPFHCTKKKWQNLGPFLVFLVPITWLHAKGRQVTGTQKKKKEGLRALPFYSMKTCPNFQRTCPSTPEEFFHFIRFWKKAEFLHMTMHLEMHYKK